MNKYPIQIGGIDIADSSENVKIIWNIILLKIHININNLYFYVW